jgi:hypothetical protein
MSQHTYKGHTVSLRLSQEGYMWACQYVISKSNDIQIDGFPDGNTYDSREKAESAALEKAKSLSDQSDLTKQPLGSG